jgi:hypothetical protein
VIASRSPILLIDPAGVAVTVADMAEVADAPGGAGVATGDAPDTVVGATTATPPPGVNTPGIDAAMLATIASSIKRTLASSMEQQRADFAKFTTQQNSRLEILTSTVVESTLKVNHNHGHLEEII